MEKYMGNKAKFCSTIYDEISKHIDLKGKTLFDPFSGTTNVSRFFKSKGTNIICNDINDLSYCLGKAYISCCEVPSFRRLYLSNLYFKNRIIELDHNNLLDEKVAILIKENKNTSNILFTEKNKRTNYLEVITYLTYFCNENDYSGIDYNFFQDNYCENGKNCRYINLVYKKTLNNILESHPADSVGRLISNFFLYPFDEKNIYKAKEELKKLGDMDSYRAIENILSKGNLVGKRMFFSLQHAVRLDNIFNTILFWKNNDFINESEYYILLTSLIETVSIFSNTSATYQAFYKDYRANTLQEFRLVIPEIDITKIKSKIYQEDAYSLIPKIKADVMYLDPPYNWRQYDSNYHLLNTIAKFNSIVDKKKFFTQIVGASGENRVQKLKYTSFNRSSTFVELLLDRISKSKCKYIALSYSDSGSNHKKQKNDITVEKIIEFFNNKKMFTNFNIVKIDSRNFESRRGNKKELIHELLFIAEKR